MNYILYLCSMKTRLTLVLSLLTLVTLGQTFTEEMDSVYTPIETQLYVSPKRDTILVPNNAFGEQIKLCWCDSTGESPIIITAPENVIRLQNKKKEKIKRKPKF